MDFDSIIRLVVSIVASFTAAAIGSLFTSRAIPTWYAGLRKPRYTPPRWVFAPVWTTLYILMAISVFLVWQKGLATPGVMVAFTLFWVQLAVNALWSVVFFGMKSRGGGVVVIAILWLLILATMIASFRVSTWAGALLVPYILWVSVASYLNVGIWVLNRPARQNTAD